MGSPDASSIALGHRDINPMFTCYPSGGNIEIDPSADRRTQITCNFSRGVLAASRPPKTDSFRLIPIDALGSAILKTFSNIECAK